MASRTLLVFLISAAATATAWSQSVRRDEDVLFQDLDVVESAGMHAQSVRDAPANVTVITERDIRVYGYRTLDEALASARGFYLSYDRAYHHAGLRGFNMPGDYGTRWQVMLNGHNLSDHIFDASGYLGQDFGLDLALVKRIEIIRGPSSSLYGSNAIFGIINVVTKAPSDFPEARVGAEIGTPGSRKAEVDVASSSSKSEFLLSGSVFNNAGVPVTVPEYGATIPAIADAERGYHSFFDFRRGEWQITAMVSSRQKGMPVPWDDAAIGDAGNRVQDARRFVEATWSRPFRGGRITWRNSWDWYSYRGLEDQARDDHASLVRNADLAQNSWLTSRLLYRFAPSRFGDITAGAEFSADLSGWQRNYDMVSPRVYNLNTDHSQVRAGILFEDEFTFNRRWKAVAGLRLDRVSRYGSAASPRLAVLYQPNDRTSWKFIAGQSYRNPSNFEQYYGGASAVVFASGLKPERAITVEANVEHKINRRWSVIAGAYRYQIEDVIELTPATGGYQYENSGRATSSGVEVEADSHVPGQINVSATLAIQRTLDASGAALPNSPRAVSSLRASRSFWGERLTLAIALNYAGARATLAGASVAPVWQPDFTLGSTKLLRGLDLQAGIHNLIDRPPVDPIALDPRVDTLPGQGRQVFVRLTWHARE